MIMILVLPDAYAGQLIYINSLVLRLQSIRSCRRVSDDPIIVIAGDHRRENGFSAVIRFWPHSACLMAAMAGFMPSISSVNHFRFILDVTIFDLDIDLVEDRNSSHDGVQGTIHSSVGTRSLG